MGAAQVELAGPLVEQDREQANAVAAERIGRPASDEHPGLAALANVSQRSSMSADFECALDMLLADIQTRSNTARSPQRKRRPAKPRPRRVEP
jgi:hypothetical protein